MEQSGTYPRTFNDYREADTEALRTKTLDDMEQALQVGLGIAVTKEDEYDVGDALYPWLT